MNSNEMTQRGALVREALSWERTPFEHGQCLKGEAADCSTFLAACYRTVGMFCAEIPHLPADWFAHTKKQFYLEEMLKHTEEFDPAQRKPQPGDIVIVKDTAIGAKVFSHGAIVVEWPIVIHCFPPCVMQSNVASYPAFRHRTLKFFNPWGTRENRGIGDTIAKVTAAIGIKPCGDCKKRQAELNRAFPYRSEGA